MEIEIKDDGSARNINQESREKDKIKEDLMRSISNIVNFIKIVNKSDVLQKLHQGEYNILPSYMES